MDLEIGQEGIKQSDVGTSKRMCRQAVDLGLRHLQIADSREMAVQSNRQGETCDRPGFATRHDFVSTLHNGQYHQLLSRCSALSVDSCRPFCHMGKNDIKPKAM